VAGASFVRYFGDASGRGAKIVDESGGVTERFFDAKSGASSERWEGLSDREIMRMKNAFKAREGYEVDDPDRSGRKEQAALSSSTPRLFRLHAREEERLGLARRYVADRCLFGVDKNPWAVEMAKLSLWLVTLQKDRPFTFLDHALVAGDSLLGITSKEQLLSFHLDPMRGKEIHRLFAPKKWIEGELARAAEAREKIESLATMTIVDAHHKAFLERQAREATSDLAVLGDLLMGAALASNGKDAALDRTLQNLAEDAIRLLPTDEEARSRASTQSPQRVKLRERLRKTARELLDQGRGADNASRTPLHWALTPRWPAPDWRARHRLP